MSHNHNDNDKEFKETAIALSLGLFFILFFLFLQSAVADWENSVRSQMSIYVESATIQIVPDPEHGGYNVTVSIRLVNRGIPLYIEGVYIKERHRLIDQAGAELRENATTEIVVHGFTDRAITVTNGTVPLVLKARTADKQPFCQHKLCYAIHYDYVYKDFTILATARP